MVLGTAEVGERKGAEVQGPLKRPGREGKVGRWRCELQGLRPEAVLAGIPQGTSWASEQKDF